MTVTFLDEDCQLVVTRYARPKNVCLRLLDTDGLPVATATLNPPYLLDAGLVAIKDYSENAGMLAALEAAGVVKRTGETIPVGYAYAHLCRLLVD